MKVGIIGSGGREHAICHSIKKSPKIEKVYCFPGNAGTSELAENIDIDISNFSNGVYSAHIIIGDEIFVKQIFKN